MSRQTFDGLAVDSGAGSMPPVTVAPDERRPMLVTSDPVLRDEVERVCAAAEMDLQVLDDPLNARPRWSRASCVLAGDDVVDTIVSAGFPSRVGLVVVTGSAQLAAWQSAVALRAEAVVLLPDERVRLSELLVERSRDVRHRGTAARVIGVIGARGGVGASTTAALVGMVAAARGLPAVLVDADAASAGADVLLGCESVAGLRWPDVAGVHGRVGAEALRSALPETCGLAVLTWGPDRPSTLPAHTLERTVATVARAAEIVVVDLGRHLDAARHGLAGRTDTMLLVAGGDPLSAAGAHRVLAPLRDRCADLRMVVREGPTGSVEPALLGAAVDLPVAMVLRHRRRMDRAINDGLGPPVSRRDARVVGHFLDDLRGRAAG